MGSTLTWMVTGISLLLGALGVGATVYYSRAADVAERARRRLEWADLQSAASDMARRIKRDCSPVAVVTPGLTGATFANLLASEFTNQPPVYVGVRVWKAAPGGPVMGEHFFKIGNCSGPGVRSAGPVAVGGEQG